jgi:hypothetical protein
MGISPWPRALLRSAGFYHERSDSRAGHVTGCVTKSQNTPQVGLGDFGLRFLDTLEGVATRLALVVTGRPARAGDLDFGRLTLRTPDRPVDDAARPRNRRRWGLLRRRWGRRSLLPVPPVGLLLLCPVGRNLRPNVTACSAPVSLRTRSTPARSTRLNLRVLASAVWTLRTVAFVEVDEAHETLLDHVSRSSWAEA